MTRALTLVMTTLVAGCSSDQWEIARAHNSIAEKLLDPSSAQFRGDAVFLQRSKDGSDEYVTVCGEVNAKNISGRYVGFKRYIYQLRNKERDAQTDKKEHTPWTSIEPPANDSVRLTFFNEDYSRKCIAKGSASG